MYSEACKILQRTFKELGDLFEGAHDQITQNGDYDALLSGARHKQKEVEKADAKAERQSQASMSGGEAGKGKAGAKGESKEVNKKKAAKEKKVCKDADGNLVKRPLSAYMLLNNFRRPVL